MQFTLHTEMNQNEAVMGLLDEVFCISFFGENIIFLQKSPIVAAEREALRKVLDVLQNAKKVLNKEPE